MLNSRYTFPTLYSSYLIVISLAFSIAAHAQKIEECANIADKAIRLECFDAAFRNSTASPPSMFSVDDARKLQRLLSPPSWGEGNSDIAQVDLENCEIHLTSVIASVQEMTRTTSDRTIAVRDLDTERMRKTKIQIHSGVKIIARQNAFFSEKITVRALIGNSIVNENQLSNEWEFLRVKDTLDASEVINLLRRFANTCEADVATTRPNDLPSGSTGLEVISKLEVETPDGRVAEIPKSLSAKTIQATLNRLGYDAGAVDGFPGPQTRQALMRLQVDNCIEPTGETDLETRALLVGLPLAQAGNCPAGIPNGVTPNTPLLEGVYVNDQSLCSRQQIQGSEALELVRIVGGNWILFGTEQVCWTKRTDISGEFTAFKGECFAGGSTRPRTWVLDVVSPRKFVDLTTLKPKSGSPVFEKCPDQSALRIGAQALFER